MPPPPKAGTTAKNDVFFDDDDEGWQEMPVVRDDFANGLDEEDRKKYHYKTPEKETSANATGNLIDFDDRGQEWREKAVTSNDAYTDYTRIRVNEEDDNDDMHLRTKFLFNEDKAMTPLSQMQATKDMLTEAQRLAYVGLCYLVAKEMSKIFKLAKTKELAPALESMELWTLKIMGRLYYHMELETPEQKMIESLAEHGVQAQDLVPSLMATHTVANPEYDPAEGKRQEKARKQAEEERLYEEEKHAEDITDDLNSAKATPTMPKTPVTPAAPFQTTANVLPPSAPEAIPGVSTSLSAADKDVTLDIRWTILCDLFLVLVADSVYDARSRFLLESVAYKLGLGWLDVVKFEQRVSEALEIQEGVEKLEQTEVIEGRAKAAKKRRYAMMGLATLGGGLVLGLSAGLLAPVIGAGLAGAFTTIGVSGTSAFLAGTGGAAVITTAGTLTGSGIAVRGMSRRTRDVRTFEILPLHNNKRVNCILTVTGFMTSVKDDVRLPFSVLDPVVGDVFSVLWEPEMLGETGAALKLLTSEALSQLSTTVLQATVMTGLMTALQWPILLSKLGYLIDNPWNNALDRARAAGLVLADVLTQRHLGVRPITLIGFSLGARVIFYCLLELAKRRAFGIVQDVFILGATLTASRQNWLAVRSVVAGRFVNGYARNDWVLNYLFRATSAGLQNIAGLRPVPDVPGLDNVDVTDKIAGHTSYRTFMPLILDQLGFPVSVDYFDEPEEPDFTENRIVVRDGEEQPKKKSWFSRRDSKGKQTRAPPRPPGYNVTKTTAPSKEGDDDLPEPVPVSASTSSTMSPVTSPTRSETTTPRVSDVGEESNRVPIHAGFDLDAMRDVIAKDADTGVLHAPVAHTPSGRLDTPLPHAPSGRAESVPPPVPGKDGPGEERRASTTPQSSRHARDRVASTPPFELGGGFDTDEGGADADGGDISSALDSYSSVDRARPSRSGPGGHPEASMSNAFARSLSLEDRDIGQVSAADSAASSIVARPDDYWNGFSASTNPTRDAWTASRLSDPYSAGSRTPTEESPQLTFAGPSGSLWDPGQNAVNDGPTTDASLRSPFASPPATASLPADILNPFAISTSDLTTGSEHQRPDDQWSPPSLPMKNKKSNASKLNLDSNPWG